MILSRGELICGKKLDIQNEPAQPTDVMKIKLYASASSNYVRRCYKGAHPACGMLHNQEFAAMLEKVNGQWIEVETDWLFRDQFNTAPIAGVSDLGLRVMAQDVEEIEGDIRLGRIRDNYTHKTYSSIEDVPAECMTEERKKYLVRWDVSRHGRGVVLKETRIF